MITEFRRHPALEALRVGIARVSPWVLSAVVGFAQEGAESGDETPPALDRGQIARVVDEYLAATRPPPQEKGWERILDRLLLYGDYRLRYESNFNLEGQESSDRLRMRLRLGANYEVSDQLLLGARLVTGDAEDPNSPHVTFGDLFDDLEISLDRAFVSWRPGGFEGIDLTGGKFNHPFYRNQVYGELVWDADVQPEGLLFQSEYQGILGLDRLDFDLGLYTILQQSVGDDSSMGVAQVRAEKRLASQVRSSLALGYYYYSDVNPDGSTRLVDRNRGNATVDADGDGQPDAYESDFGILNVIAALDLGQTRPTTLSAEYILNTRAEIDGDTGWAVGVAHGTAAKQGDWRVYYQWQVLEQDSVFSLFAQDDFLLATNHSSHLLGWNYQVSDNIGVHLWGLVSSLEDAGSGMDDEQWRVRLDINIKF